MPVAPSVPGRWTTLSRVLLFFLTCAFLLGAGAALTRGISGRWSQVALGSVTSVATILLTLLFVRWDRIHLRDVGVVPGRQTVGRVVAGFALGFLLVGLQTSLVKLGGHVHWVRAPSSGLASMGIALLIYLTLALREELAFRGYPLRRLERAFGPWTAQFVVGLSFGLEHIAGGYTWTNALMGAVFGSLLFGVAALTTRGLALPIGIHAAWNFGQWMIGEKDGAGLWVPVVEQGYAQYVDHGGMVAYLLVFGAATIGLWLFGRYRGDHQ